MKPPELTDQQIRSELEKRGQLRFPGFGTEEIMSDILFCPTRCEAIDRIENGVGDYSNKSIEELQRQYPDAFLADQATIRQHTLARYKTEPKRITREYFLEMLEIMPPENWHTGHRSESFNLCEHYTHDIASTFVRIGSDYWEFRDRAGLTHAERLQRVIDAAQSETHTNATTHTEA